MTGETAETIETAEETGVRPIASTAVARDHSYATATTAVQGEAGAEPHRDARLALGLAAPE
jgi:hypothetical protein